MVQTREGSDREAGRPCIDSDHHAGRRRLRGRLCQRASPRAHRHASPRADRSCKRRRDRPGFRSHGYACNGSRSGGRTGSLTDPNSHAAAHSNAGPHTGAGLDSHAHASAGPHGHANVLAHPRSDPRPCGDRYRCPNRHPHGHRHEHPRSHGNGDSGTHGHFSSHIDVDAHSDEHSGAQPSVDPALAGYSPLLIEAVSSYPSGLDFVGDDLSPEEKNILDWADSRLFSNPNFLASKYGPDNWPSDVKLASVQSVPLLMLAIDIQKKPYGKHVINWEVDGLDRILDELGVYEGVCTSCYGKNYDTREKVVYNYHPITDDPGHAHREMLKTFAYLAKADGEGVLIRGFMENDADDFELLYNRDAEAARRVGSATDTAFGWRNLSFMSQVKLPDGSVKSFPTMVHEIVGDAGSEREAAERWFGHLNEVMTHFTGGTESFANLYRPYSQTPYTPEPGYLLIVKEAGSPSSTGLTTSAFRSLGLKAEQFFSPEKGARTGSVDVDGHTYYYDGNDLGLDRFTKDLPVCAFFRTLKQVEYFDYHEHCDQPDGPLSLDRDPLVVLYHATGGANWKNNDHWLSDRPISEWFGVDTIDGRVTFLYLRENDLTGQIPSELGKLTSLKALLLADNPGLTGCVPAELQGGLRRLSGAKFC